MEMLTHWRSHCKVSTKMHNDDDDDDANYIDELAYKKVFRVFEVDNILCKKLFSMLFEGKVCFF